jgi:hypothetical protein
MEPGRIELPLNQPSQSATADLERERATICAMLAHPFLYKLVLAWENFTDQERNCIVAVANTCIEASNAYSKKSEHKTCDGHAFADGSAYAEPACSPAKHTETDQETEVQS